METTTTIWNVLFFHRNDAASGTNGDIMNLFFFLYIL